MKDITKIVSASLSLGGIIGILVGFGLGIWKEAETPTLLESRARIFQTQDSLKVIRTYNHLEADDVFV